MASHNASTPPPEIGPALSTSSFNHRRQGDSQALAAIAIDLAQRAWQGNNSIAKMNANISDEEEE